jgi:ankyrin repeat protein
MEGNMRQIQTLSGAPGTQHLGHPQLQTQSPGNVYVVQTPQGLQGRTLQPTATGLIPGYGHAHVPQLYQQSGQPGQLPQPQTVQSPMGLYTHHQAQYSHYPSQQHQTMAMAAGQQQTAQMMSLKRPYPEESELIAGHAEPLPTGSAGLKHGGAVYVDQYGRPFRYADGAEATGSAEFANYTTDQAHTDGPPPSKRVKLENTEVQDVIAAMADEPAPMTLAEVHALLNHENEEGPMASLADIADADMENGEDYEIESGDVQGFLPPGTRLASRPQRPATTRDNAGTTPLKDKTQSTLRARAKLLGIFEASASEGGDDVDLDKLLVQSPKSSPIRGNGDTSLESITARSEIDIDQVIDERGHTALHWAASLARENLVGQLIGRGADINRGNFAGETPLMRAVLATNNAESAASFQSLLSNHLGDSLRTIDNSHRTVLHHISAVAGIKGRSASANTYLSTLLAWMATVETPDQIRDYVNIQDVNGDTALNVAARVGNRNIVKLLLDAGADKTKANKLGLRPGDFGVQVDVSRCMNSKTAHLTKHVLQ